MQAPRPWKPPEVLGSYGGYGIQAVDVSGDGGKTWQGAQLGDDAGRFSFRAFSLSFRCAFPFGVAHRTVAPLYARNMGRKQTAAISGALADRNDFNRGEVGFQLVEG